MLIVAKLMSKGVITILSGRDLEPAIDPANGNRAITKLCKRGKTTGGLSPALWGLLFSTTTQV